MVKLFRLQKHADAFRKGILYASPLSCFQQMENQQGISDPFEGSIWSGPDTIFEIGNAPDKMVDITPFLRGPIRFQGINYVNVVCFHLLKTPFFYSDDADPLTDEVIGKVNIPVRLQNEFGSYLVVIPNMTEFIRRAKAKLQHLYETRKIAHFRGDKVIYKNHHPIMWGSNDALEAAFYKREAYAYQNEYRIAVEPSKISRRTGDPIKINIGNIEDITIASDSSQNFEICAKPK